MTDKTISGAHFKALRISLGLTHADCQEIFMINDRSTIKKWENGKSIIPNEVAEEMKHIAGQAHLAVTAFFVTHQHNEVSLVVYPDEVPECVTMSDTQYLLQYTVNGMICAKFGDRCRVVAFNESSFNAWCDAENRNPTDKAIADWATAQPDPRTLDSLHR